MTIEVHVSFQIRTLNLLGIYAQEWIVGSQDHYMFSFLRTLHPALIVAGQMLCVLLSPQLHSRSQGSVNALRTAWPSLPSDSATWPEKGVSLSLSFLV